MINISEPLNLHRESRAEPSMLRPNIPKFQQLIWKSQTAFSNKNVEEILRDLAYDLNYYEPDARIRNKDSSFFGDEKALEEIRLALATFDSEPQ